MRCLLLLTIFSVNILFIGCSISVVLNLKPKMEEQLKKYALKTSKTTFLCNLIIKKEEPNYCYETVTVFLRYLSCTNRVLTVEDLALSNITDRTGVSFIFVELLADLQVTMDYIIRSTFFTNQSQYKFLLCYKILTNSEVQKVANTLWRHRILNFLLIYFFNETLTLASYNPFKDTLTFADAWSDFEEFPDKLKDMNGHVVQLATTLGATVIPKKYNFDISFLEVFQKVTNSTIVLENHRVSNMYNQLVYRMIGSNDAEFCCITVPCSFEDIPEDLVTHVTCSYPHIMNNIIALVPKPHLVQKTLHSFTSLESSVLYVVAAMLITILQKKPVDFKYFIVLLVSGIGSPITSFKKHKYGFTFFWLMGNIFTVAVINVMIMQLVMEPHYTKPISTLKDLNVTKLPIYTYGYGSSLLANTTIINLEALKKAVMRNEGNAIFVGSYKTLDMYMKVNLLKNVDFKYEIMKEILIPKYGSYVMKTRSVFLQKVHQVADQIKEVGVQAVVPAIKNKPFNVSSTLNLWHFKVIFLFHLIGSLVSFGVFIIEVVSKKKIFQTSKCPGAFF